MYDRDTYPTERFINRRYLLPNMTAEMQKMMDRIFEMNGKIMDKAEELKKLVKIERTERGFILNEAFRDMHESLGTIESLMGKVIREVEKGIRQNYEFRERTYRLSPAEFSIYYKTLRSDSRFRINRDKEIYKILTDFEYKVLELCLDTMKKLEKVVKTLEVKENEEE